MRISSSSLFVLSPAFLVSASWLLMCIVTLLSYIYIDDLHVLNTYLKMHGLDFDYPLFGFFWLLFAFLVFIVTSFFTQPAFPQETAIENLRIDFSEGVRIVSILQVIFFFVTITWVAISASKVGGINVLIVLVQEEVNMARSIMLENKLFTGMRLFYAGFVGTGTFAAVAIAYHLRTKSLSRSDYKKCLLVFAASILLLAILPVVLSQRILLFNLLIASYVAAAFAYGRLLWVRYMPIAAGLLFLVWMGREVVTGELFADVSPVELAFQKLLFYFVNDFWNSVNPLGVENLPHSYGMYSFQFLLYFTQTHEFVYSLMTETSEALTKVRGGGEFPIFTVPYIDFGAFGILLVALVAFIAKKLFWKAHENIKFVPVYGLLAATLVFCTHSAYYTNQEFWFNVIVVTFLASRIKYVTNN